MTKQKQEFDLLRPERTGCLLWIAGTLGYGIGATVAGRFGLGYHQLVLDECIGDKAFVDDLRHHGSC